MLVLAILTRATLFSKSSISVDFRRIGMVIDALDAEALGLANGRLENQFDRQ